MNFHNKGKVWENTNILKWRWFFFSLSFFLSFFFLFFFLRGRGGSGGGYFILYIYFFTWSRNPWSSQNMRWMNSDVTGNVWENTNSPKLQMNIGFLHISCQAEMQYNSQSLGWFNSHITEQVLKNTDASQVQLSLKNLELMKSHAISSAWKFSQ